MAANPVEALVKAWSSVANCVQAHFSHLLVSIDTGVRIRSSSSNASSSPIVVFRRSPEISPVPREEPSLEEDTSLTREVFVSRDFEAAAAAHVTKEELGRATWTLLHTIAAQFPDKPTRRQRRDVKELMAILSRVYPCKQCAEHFKEVLNVNPVEAGSQDEFSQWLCRVHNIVNRSLGKSTFPCQRVNARWGKLDCPDRACDLEGGSNSSI